jgi:DNA-binding LytR/AlgR family response regulator
LKASQKALELHALKQKKTTPDNNQPNHIFIKCDGKIEKVLLDELLYIEAMANYVTLYTKTGKLIAYLTIKGILESLPPDKFLQVHKSHIVNTDFITTIEGNMLHVANAKITVGQSFLDSVMKGVLKDRFVKR